MPKAQLLRLFAFKGVEDQTDAAMTPARLLRKAENLQFGDGVLSLRTGHAGDWAADSPTPFTGIGTFRQAPTSTVSEVAFQLAYGTRNDIDDDGNDVTRGALYVNARDGYGSYEVTPEDDLLDSDLPLSTGDTEPKDASFAQFADPLGASRMYVVDGQNGMIRWDGWDLTGSAPPKAARVKDLTPPADFGTVPAFPSIAPLNGLVTSALLNWKEETSGEWDISPESATGEGFSEWNAPVILGYNSFTMTPTNTTGAAVGKHLHFDLNDFSDATLKTANFDAGRHQSEHLLIGAKVVIADGSTSDPFDTGTFTPIRLWIGKGDPTDAGSYNQAAVAAGESFYWDVTFTQAGAWEVFHLALPQSALYDSLRQNTRFFSWECRDVAGASAGVVNFSIQMGEVSAPGEIGIGLSSVPGAQTRYVKAQRHNPATDYTTLPTSAAQVDFLDFAEGVHTDSLITTYSAGLPVGKADIRIQFPADAGPNEEIRVYLTTPDPALDNPDGGNYHRALTALRSDADSNGQLTAYISISDDALQVADAMPNPTEVLQTGDDAPQILVAKDTRLIALKSKAHPNTGWIGDIGIAESFPSLGFEENATPGTGGTFVVGHSDGDEIMAAGIRQNELLVAKERGVWAVQFRNEGTAGEFITVDYLTSPGTVAPRSFCRIPNGWVWFYPSGLYFLADGAERATELPITEAIRRTIEEIPLAALDKVAVGFDPIRDVIMVAVAEPGQDENSCLLVLDRRLRAKGNPYGEWIGKWAIRDICGQSGVDWQPKLLHWDGANLFITRADLPVIDRAKTLLGDIVPYSDFEQPIRVKGETGWLTPAPGKKIRVTERGVKLTHESVTPGDAKASVALTVRVGTRPNGAEKAYNYNYTVDPYKQPNGLMSSGTAGEGNREAVGTLEGEQVRVSFEGECSSTQPVSIWEMWLRFIVKGNWRG